MSNKKSIFSDIGKCEEVFLYPQIEDNKFRLLEEVKLSMLANVDVLRIPDSSMLEPSLNALISKDLFQSKKKRFLEMTREDQKALSLDLTACNEGNLFCGLLWKTCLREKNAEVQHVLTNYSLGKSGMGDKFLYIKDSISSEKKEQQLAIRVHVFATDELLFKALQYFVAEQERKFPEPVFLNYNDKNGCFELLDVKHFQSKKKAVYGKLDEKYGVLKQWSKTIVNRQRIEDLMDALLKQRESETEELDVAIVQEIELLLKNEEEVRKLNLTIKDIHEQNEKIMGSFEEMQNELNEKKESLKRLRQAVNLLAQENVSKTDLEENYKILKQKYVELEKNYKQLGKEEPNSNTWEHLQAQRKKNAEDCEAFQKQEAEHERAWQLYKEEVKQQQEAEVRRQQAEEEQRRREEEARRPRGVYGQQIFDYIERTGTPKKKNCAANARNRNVIVPTTLYTDPAQLPPKYRQYFSIIMSEQN